MGGGLRCETRTGNLIEEEEEEETDDTPCESYSSPDKKDKCQDAKTSAGKKRCKWYGRNKPGGLRCETRTGNLIEEEEEEETDDTPCEKMQVVRPKQTRGTP